MIWHTSLNNKSHEIVRRLLGRDETLHRFVVLPNSNG